MHACTVTRARKTVSEGNTLAIYICQSRHIGGVWAIPLFCLITVWSESCIYRALKMDIFFWIKMVRALIDLISELPKLRKPEVSSKCVFNIHA